MRSRLAASAKKANTLSRGSGRLIDVLRTWSVTLLIVISRLAPLLFKPRPQGLNPGKGCLLKSSIMKHPGDQVSGCSESLGRLYEKP